MQRVDGVPQGATKWTALHRASERGRTEVVTTLLDAGAVSASCARPVAPTALSDPFSRTCSQNHALPTASGGDTALHLAADRGHIATVQELLRHGADPRAKSKRGWTPLHAALYSNRQQVVRELLRAGADPEDQNEDGLTPREVSQRLSLSSPRASLRGGFAASSPRTEYGLTPRDLAGLSSPRGTVGSLLSSPMPFSPGARATST